MTEAIIRGCVEFNFVAFGLLEKRSGRAIQKQGSLISLTEFGDQRALYLIRGYTGQNFWAYIKVPKNLTRYQQVTRGTSHALLIQLNTFKAVRRCIAALLRADLNGNGIPDVVEVVDPDLSVFTQKPKK